jgi:hypothetical protein
MLLWELKVQNEIASQTKKSLESRGRKRMRGVTRQEICYPGVCLAYSWLWAVVHVDLLEADANLQIRAAAVFLSIDHAWNRVVVAIIGSSA